MRTENLQQPFEIFLFEVEEWQATPHRHNFFELVFILEGTGKQCINKNKVDYHQGNVFVLTPQDCHSFDIATPTKFVFIRFTDMYFSGTKSQHALREHAEWLKKLEYIFYNHNRLPGCILKDANDRYFAKALVEGIIREYFNKGLYHQEVIRQTLVSLLNIVARNIASQEPVEVQANPEKKQILHMLAYIQRNIYHPEAIRAEALAEEFHISPSYLGEYFKKHTGVTLQKYISQYKLKVVEARLEFSDMRISEIVRELGFTDESHLNRLFKSYHGISPSEFRKQVQAKALHI